MKQLDNRSVHSVPIADNALQINRNGNSFYLRVALKTPSTSSIEIFDVLGRKIFTDVERRFDAGEVIIPLPDLPKGVYFASLRTDSGVSTVKFIR